MNSLQLLEHPGPRTAERFAAVPCRAQPVQIRLAAGVSFEQAVVQGFAEAGFSAGYLRLADVAFERLSYVIPAPAPGDGRAAWYSKTYVLDGAAIAEAGLHLGVKGGAPFLHCHGLWSKSGGPLLMGHLLAPASMLSEEAVATGWGLTGAELEVKPDTETGFDLFAPTAAGDMGTGHPAMLCTLRPNEDPHVLLAAAGDTLGEAQIEGIGSLINTTFEDKVVESYATEVLLRSGCVARGSVTLDVASVGFDGVPMTGILRPHENRVCITAELLLIGDDAEHGAPRMERE